MNLRNVDLGDLPTWLSAVSAMAALAAALWAGRAAWRVVSVERERDEERLRLDARAQADLVAAWPSLVLSEPTDQESPIRWGVAVRNGSALPVHQVQVTHVPISPHGQVEQTVVFELVPPGDFLVTGHELYRRPDSVVPRPFPAELRGRWYIVELRFTDMSGRRWHRDRHGNLVRVQVDPKLV
ncbi:hypothetical protein [Micromonospora trifolii]|uniref:hypothetical protein n=1 Tax=Micromonospora trifolii TaxID=2911208 RepID=UPI003CE988AD